MIKRVLIFSLAYEPFIGGAEVAIKEITNRLADRFAFDLLTVNLDGQQKALEEIGPVKVHRLGRGQLSKYTFPWLALKRAQELHRQNNYPLTWAMMANQAGWAALKFKKQNPQVKYLLTLQEGDSEFDIWLRTFFLRPTYKAIYQKADQLQAISGYLKQRAERLGAKAPVVILPNGGLIKNQPVLSENNQKEIEKINSGLAPGDKLIISVSRLVKKNGLTDLIKALKFLPANFKLRIIGAGPLKNQFKKLVQKLKLEERVEFCGQIDFSNLWRYYQWPNQIFIRPSLSEGLGNVFLEAMSMGVPVIATPVGGIVDFLREGETGWFCQVKNPQSIAERVKYIFDQKNQILVENVKANAQKMVAENYNWDRVALKMRNIFEQLTS